MIISVSGFIGSGKDSVADYLCQKYSFKRHSFANSLKDAISIVFGWDRELLEGLTPESRKWREEVDEWWAEKLSMPTLTPRWIMQYWGTELTRNKFHNDIWVCSLLNKLRNTNDNIVITDCRFSNELSAIKKINGITIRVERGAKPKWYNDALILNNGPDKVGYLFAKNVLERHNVHESEYSSVGFAYNHIIQNNGTLEELYEKIDSIVNL